MKVALISLARRGGMVHFQIELANALGDLTPTTAISSTAARASAVSPSVRRLTIDTGRSRITSLMRLADPATWNALWKALRSSEADLFHIVGAHEWNPLVATMIRLQRRPIVFTVHDPVPHRGAPIAMRFSNAATSRLADALVVLTRRGAQDMIARGVAAYRLHVIPHGVYSFFRQSRLPNVRPGRVILYFGRMEPYKGTDVLLEAFVRVRKSLRDWKLVLAGAGDLPIAPGFQDLAGVEIINRYVADEDVAGLMQRARMVVLPYTDASQSGAAATAFAFGRPVIATRVGGLAEMVTHGKTGLLVAPNDPGALARAIRTLARDPRRAAAMGRAAAAVGRGVGSWKRIAGQHMDLYRQVLGNRASK